MKLCSRKLNPRNALTLAIGLAAMILINCSQEGSTRYNAERKLYKARKLRDDVLSSNLKPEFLARSLDAYRAIVQEHGTSTSPEIEQVVVSAQMELAELEFRAGLLNDSRIDFEKAAQLAKHISPARANAIYSIGAISEELGDAEQAARAYESFYKEFLQTDSLAATARMNPRYLVTPLKLGDLASRGGDSNKAQHWYREAERIYAHILGHESDERILKETRFNMLTALLQQRDWKQALDFSDKLMSLYTEPVDASQILFLKAKIHESGLGELEKAKSLYLSIAQRFPESENAPNSILAAAALDRRSGRTREATKLYEQVINEYRDRIAEVVEAHWQIAQIDEKTGRWEDASLRYKKIYSDYPETLQGFEAPLRIAEMYKSRGERDAAQAAYNTAIEHYRKLADGQRRPSSKIMAEQYFVRALSEAERWKEVAERLMRLPDLYPNYEPFKANYLLAASIYERELNDLENARRALETCIAKHPETDLARSAKERLAKLKKDIK